MMAESVRLVQRFLVLAKKTAIHSSFGKKK